MSPVDHALRSKCENKREQYRPNPQKWGGGHPLYDSEGRTLARRYETLSTTRHAPQLYRSGGFWLIWNLFLIYRFDIFKKSALVAIKKKSKNNLIIFYPCLSINSLFLSQILAQFEINFALVFLLSVEKNLYRMRICHNHQAFPGCNLIFRTYSVLITTKKRLNVPGNYKTQHNSIKGVKTTTNWTIYMSSDKLFT